MRNTVIFDLDGTLADIEKRRVLSTHGNGKMDWDRFFDPKNIELDEPNLPVVFLAKTMWEKGFRVVIFSGRLDVTQTATERWLEKHQVKFDILKMRPEHMKFVDDAELKKEWLEELGKDSVFLVVDDRDKVVKMWRNEGLNTFQVADGNF
tara:strand:- start:1744 stop:2193 length:450 start_codon:yes stop_codon:yes gene_type:complete